VDPAAPMNRRTALKRAGALAVGLGALEAVGPFSFTPVRAGASIGPSDIQFDISAFLPVPPQNYGSDVQFQMPPVHTVFLTAALARTPTRADQAEMNRALGALERHYPWGATHLVTFVAYGLPYFGRLPGSLVARHMPRLASEAGRYVLEEAQPGPTDVSPANPGISKLRYNVNVRIERNDLLFTLARRQPGHPVRRARLVRREQQAARARGALPGLERADQVHLEPPHVRADGAAESSRKAASSALRQLHPAPVADVDGFC
jgi:hypothetical protein